MKRRRYKYGCFYCKACRRYPKADEVDTIRGRGGRLYHMACGTQVRMKARTVPADEMDSRPLLVIQSQLFRTIDWRKVDEIAAALNAAAVEVLLG